MQTAELLQLTAKAERQRITSYEPAFSLDVELLDRLSVVAGPFRGRVATVADLASLLATPSALEWAAGAAHTATLRRFGRTMHLFAPLYLSNECVSECTYCGFQVFNRGIARKTLTVAEVAAEARLLADRGFRHILLVAAEHPKLVSASYVTECIAAVAAVVPQVSVEVQVWTAEEYALFVDAGGDGLVVFQEVYDPRRYGEFHLKGNKRFYDWRLGAPERAAAAGMRRIGLGTLLGLNPNWRWEVLALAVHAQWLTRRYWGVELTVTLPRLEPAAGYATPAQALSDAEFTLAMCGLRLLLRDAGIVLSTRERPALRDGLVKLGVTHISAGSRTEPGGYAAPGAAEEQFQVGDHRSPSEVASMLRSAGYEPVWKDWQR